MPHQCVRCGNLYEDGAEEILKGCSCGARLFFYIKKSNLEKIRAATKDLSSEEKQQIEEDVYDIVGAKPAEPVVLDMETIRIMEPGKYEVDLVNLFNNKPVIYKLGDGKYMIDLPETFKKLKHGDN